jgi:hypothetical protein
VTSILGFVSEGGGEALVTPVAPPTTPRYWLLLRVCTGELNTGLVKLPKFGNARSTDTAAPELPEPV